MFDTYNIYTCNEQKLDLIISKLKTMGENLNEITAALAAANEKADKIQADVTYLKSQIDNVDGETPTAEEWAAVKEAANNLNNKLQGIDDQTPDQGTTEPGA